MITRVVPPKLGDVEYIVVKNENHPKYMYIINKLENNTFATTKYSERLINNSVHLNITQTKGFN